MTAGDAVAVDEIGDAALAADGRGVMDKQRVLAFEMAAFAQEMAAAFLVDGEADRVREMRRGGLRIGGTRQSHRIDPEGEAAAEPGQGCIDPGREIVPFFGCRAFLVGAAKEETGEQRAVLAQDKPVIDERGVIKEIRCSRCSSIASSAPTHVSAFQAAQRARGIIGTVAKLPKVDARQLGVRLRHQPEQADAKAPDKKARNSAKNGQARDANARAGDRGDEHEFALTAQEQVWAVQRAIDRRLPERAHPITAPLLKSVFKRSAANTMSEMTRTSMMMRRTNSLISPPKTRMAPVTTMPRSEMA